MSLTSLHPGVGRAETAHVDLPVQRDEFGLPTIWASSLKGAVRGRIERGLFNGGTCTADVGECANFIAAFGPRPEVAHEHASSVLFLDAKLVAIPARSLKGVWLWATSPMLLTFVKLYAQALGVEVKLPEPPPISPGQVALTSGNYVVGDGRTVINEEELEVVTTSAPALDIPPIRKAANIAGERGVAYLNDEDFTRLARRSLLVQYRVRLNERKTVETGPWSEEYVPPFTVFVSGIYCARSPQKVKVKVRDEVKEIAVSMDPCRYVAERARGAIWMGGKEAVGKGLSELVW